MNMSGNTDIHYIYFMSEKQVTDKNYIGRLFNLDIELRGNPGNLTTLPPSFIIDRDKEKKIITGSHEVIKERSESKGFIDIPDVEEFVKTRLENAGYSPNENIKPISPNKTYITPSVDGRWERSLNADEIKCIITLLKPFYKEGNRQNICLWLSGWMQKAEINFQSSIKVIELLSKDDTNSEKKERLGALKSSYRGLDNQNNKGSAGIYELIYKYYENNKQENVPNATNERFFKIKKIIVHPLSYLGVINSLNALKDGERGSTRHIKQISSFLRNRFHIIKDDLTGEHWIYNHEKGVYELYNDDKFLEFLYTIFNEEIFTMQEAKMLKSIFARTKVESDHYIAFKNCLLDLETLEPQEFDPEEFVTFQVPYDWNPKARRNSVEEKLKEILIDEGGDYEGEADKVKQFLQLVGYCFEKGNPRQKIFIFIGPPGSGKTQLVLTIGGLFKGGVASVPLQQFKERFGLQALLNKRINTLYDISKQEINDPSIIKAVSGNDSITIDRKNKEPITLEKGLPVKTIGSGNELPIIVDESNAMWERLVIINLNNIFRESNKREYNLAEKLLQNNEGMSWLIYEGIKEYKKIKDKKTPFIMELDSFEAKKEYLKESNPCKYAAEELFYKTNNETDFYPTYELIKMITKLLKNEELRIPRSNKEYYRALEQIGGELKQRRILGEITRGYIMIKPYDENIDPIKDRLNHETIIGIDVSKFDKYIEDFSNNEQALFEIITNKKLEINDILGYKVKEIIDYAYNDIEMDKKDVIKILESWKREGWVKLDNQIYINKDKKM